MSRAAGALARSADPPLSTLAAPLPAGIDPLALWRALPDLQRHFWQRPAAGEAVAALGVAAVVRAEGPQRLATVASAVRALGLPPDAVLVGGFAFDGQHAPAGSWRGFAGAEWIVPRLALVRRRGRAVLVASACGASPTALARELERGLAALASPPAESGPATTPARYQVTALDTPRAWRRAVEATVRDIAAGRIEKLVLARACEVEASAAFDPVRVLARLRRAYPGCAIFGVGRGPATFVGATPECLARVEDGRVRTAALAGSAPRGTTPEADRALARALGASTKERAEHRVVVDHLHARLAPLCDRLTIADRPHVVRTEAVQHLCTPVEGTLRAGIELLDVVQSLHPTPAVCGAPHAAALDALTGRERLVRGWYAGGVGWLGTGTGEVAVALRTALLHGNRALLHAGCGIVAGSSWEAELEETRWKLRPLLTALLEV